MRRAGSFERSLTIKYFLRAIGKAVEKIELAPTPSGDE